MYASSCIFSDGIKNEVNQFFLAARTAGKMPFILFTEPSSQSSQKNKLVDKREL